MFSVIMPFLEVVLQTYLHFLEKDADEEEFAVGTKSKSMQLLHGHSLMLLLVN